MATTTRSTGRRQPKRTGPNPLVIVTIAVVVLAALVALGLTLVGGDDETTMTELDTATAVVDGDALVPLPESGNDPAVGLAAPRIEGVDGAGEAVTIPSTGRPTLVLFLAHWCPHCQAEVPVVQQWLDDGALPEGVDFVAVATATNESRPNYPPSAWLEREEWSAPTIADADNTAATTYGLSAFPFWVAIDADGQVVARTTGELTPAQITALADTARGV